MMCTSVDVLPVFEIAFVLLLKRVCIYHVYVREKVKIVFDISVWCAFDADDD